MKTFPMIATGSGLLWAGNAALAQSDNMMGGRWNHGWMGGYGGPWVAVVLLVLLIGFAVWVIRRK